MTDTSTAAVTRLLENVTPGPWHVDGPLWNKIIWSSSDNRVCFMAHTSGLDDARDLATAAFIAAARELVPALLAERDALQAEVARLSHALAAERKLADDLEAALHELNATVLGECPSLLNEDSGGSGRLAVDVDNALARHASRRKE